MLKIRLQGTTRDIKWFLKMMERDKRFVMNNPSEIMDIRGSNRHKKVYTEVFRSDEDMKKYAEEQEINRRSRYYGTGTVFLQPKNKY